MSKFGALLGLVLGAVTGYLLSVGEPLIALAVIAVSTPAAVTINWMLRRRAERLGQVLQDEMQVSIAEKSSLLTLRASVITISVLLIVMLWPTFFNLNILPAEVVNKLHPGLLLSLDIILVTYLVSYTHYMRSKEVIEG